MTLEVRSGNWEVGPERAPEAGRIGGCTLLPRPAVSLPDSRFPLPTSRALLLLVTVVLLLAACAVEPPDTGVDVAAALGGDDVAGYLRADRPRTFRFPEDHGPHPGFRNEWWYVTGNLQSDNGRRFGFQITFFRVALTPEAPDSPSAWATDHVWMAHFALTDVAAGRHHAFERFARGAAGLAGAQLGPFRVWLEDWRLAALEGDDLPWRLTLQEQGVSLSLELEARKPPVLQGDHGLSQKGPGEGNASYYYSMTRLDARGHVTVDRERHAVGGSAWLDREWSTSALAEGQAGWDWFALQLDEGREVMYYHMRRNDGSTDPHSKGLLVHEDGSTRLLRREDMDLHVLRHWRSPRGRVYPVAWRLGVAPLGRVFEVRAVLDAQEMALTARYWEGAVDVFDDGEAVGRGYVELTGY
jgi:predicted secreted hydrolase